MAIEIVDFPIKNGGSFHSKMLVHQRVETFAAGAIGGLAEPQDLVASFASCNGDPSFLFDWTAGKRTEIPAALGQPRFRSVSFVFFEDESENHLRNLETLSPGDTHQDLIGGFLRLAFQISWGRDFGTATSESEQCHVPWWHSGWHFRERAGWRHSAGILSESLLLCFFCSFGRGVAIPNHIGCFKFLGSMPLQLNTTFLQASLVSKCHNI